MYPAFLELCCVLFGAHLSVACRLGAPMRPLREYIGAYIIDLVEYRRHIPMLAA